MSTPNKFLSLILLLTACAAVHAALPVISTGERTVFSDDFTDNRNAWTNMAVVNGTGSPATTKAAIVKSAWTPSLADHTAVTSAVIFKTPIILGKGVLSLYMSVRADDLAGHDNNRFWITLNESTGQGRFAGLVIRPSANGAILYRDGDDSAENSVTASTREVFKTASTYYSFKLTLTASPAGKGPASAEAFYYDTKTAKYVSLGVISQSIFLRSGIFTNLAINCRNGENGAVWFDSVAVTQGAATSTR